MPDFFPMPGTMFNPDMFGAPMQVNGLVSGTGWVQANWGGVPTTVTPSAFDGFYLHIHGSGSMVRATYLIDIGIGDNPNQVAILSSLLHNTGQTTYTGNTTAYPMHTSHAGYWPIAIPASTKVWFRSICSQSPQLSGFDVRMFGLRSLIGAFSPGGGVVDSLGIGSGTGFPVQTTAANVWGSTQTIAASASTDYCALTIRAITAHNVADWDQGDQSGAVWIDAMVGAAGQEQTVASWYHPYSGTLSAPFPWIPAQVPRSARLSLRAKHEASDNPAITHVVTYALRGA